MKLARHSLKNGSKKEAGTMGHIQNRRQKHQCQKMVAARNVMGDAWYGVVVTLGVLLGKASKKL